VDLDEGPDALPYSVQLANALKKNATRVIDLFRSWDTDGDGEVTRKEFHTAMGLLGLEVPKESVDSLFSEWDKDGGGAINFGELKKILSARVQSPTEKKIAAAEVKIQEAAAAASIVGKLKADATTGLASKLKKK
jgi:Ca2+-binding EF-hand superfamily protein